MIKATRTSVALPANYSISPVLHLTYNLTLYTCYYFVTSGCTLNFTHNYKIYVAENILIKQGVFIIKTVDPLQNKKTKKRKKKQKTNTYKIKLAKKGGKKMEKTTKNVKKYRKHFIRYFTSTVLC